MREETVVLYSYLRKVNNRMIIGLCGVAESGKDTVADILVSEYGYAHQKFSQQIKEAYYALDPIVHYDGARAKEIVDEVGWDEAKKVYPEIRRGLQRLGTEVGRNLWGYNFWVDKAMWNLQRGPVVFSDARFPNEWEAVRAVGGEIWLIRRPGKNPINTHASDNQWDDSTVFEATIDNDGSLDDLIKKVKYLIVTNSLLTQG